MPNDSSYWPKYSILATAQGLPDRERQSLIRSDGKAHSHRTQNVWPIGIGGQPSNERATAGHHDPAASIIAIACQRVG